MKYPLLITLLLVMSSLAKADFAQSIQEKNCETPEVKKLIGNKGSCRVVIAPKKVEKEGECRGYFMNSLQCKLHYYPSESLHVIHLVCGADLENPTIDQLLEAQAIDFKVLTLIKDKKGKDILRPDPRSYTMITSEMIKITRSGEIKENEVLSQQEIALNVENSNIKLSGVVCD